MRDTFTTLKSSDQRFWGARCSSVEERLVIVPWVVGSIPNGTPIEFQPVLEYPVFEMVHIGIPRFC